MSLWFYKAIVKLIQKPAALHAPNCKLGHKCSVPLHTSYTDDYHEHANKTTTQGGIMFPATWDKNQSRLRRQDNLHVRAPPASATCTPPTDEGWFFPLHFVKQD